MLYSFVFFILNNFICQTLTSPWENFVDRLDLLITQSYLIVRCNDNEVQISRHIKTYDELLKNFQCTNKDEIFQHGIDKTQLIDFLKVTRSCQPDKSLRLESIFQQIKASVSKDENGVDWPYLHTPYTKEKIKSNPIELDFFQNKEIKFILTDLTFDDLPETEQNAFIKWEFLNRPLFCRVRLNKLHKTNPENCSPDAFKSLLEPLCYYKVRFF